MTTTGPLRQRAEYTYKFNLKTGRHGWLRLTPAYSVKIVEDLIEECVRPKRILDPFSGTGTTALSAAYHGHEGVTTDINPFLIWLGRAKTAYYSPAALESTRAAGRKVLDLVNRESVQPIPPPPIYNIKRWWSDEALRFLCSLRAAIDEVTAADSQERTLLLIAFCRSLIDLSNAAFNHQSMSFKNGQQASFAPVSRMEDVFSDDLAFVLRGAAENPRGAGIVLQGDSRHISEAVEGLFDLVITSPPYANRMSYIRELRPYMYWLGYLVNGRDAGDLDWQAIGGTWGIATSRLIEWQRESEHLENELLESAVERIAHEDNKSGVILANYVIKYFDDVWTHLQGLRCVLKPAAEVHYIVGNSTFYSVLLPVEQIYAAMLDTLGFKQIECKPIRKRNSKKELIEFDVTAIWPG
jgi:hypothetical protein